MGLRMSYIQDENVRIFTKMLAYLAFLLSQIVVNSFEQLDELREQSNLEIIGPLYESFEDTYRTTNKGWEQTCASAKNQDPISTESHAIARFQDPGSPGSHTKPEF